MIEGNAVVQTKSKPENIQDALDRVLDSLVMLENLSDEISGAVGEQVSRQSEERKNMSLVELLDTLPETLVEISNKIVVKTQEIQSKLF